MSPTVSVALCTHNGSTYLGEQLASILRQTVMPDEIVLSDDASTDGTVGLARMIMAASAADGSRIPTLVVLENSPALGVTKNFEQAVRHCGGDVIALCDQDDLWRNDRLERMLLELERRPHLLLLHSDARLVDGVGKPLGTSLMQAIGVTQRETRQVRSGQAFQALLRRNLVTGATVVFRRSLLEQALPFFEPWVHDEWLAILASITGSIDFLPEELIDYRQHGNNQIGAVKLTLGGKVRKLLEPRDARNQRLVERGESLLKRLTELGSAIPPSSVDLVRQKVLHDRARRDLPRSRVRRVLPVLRAAFAGHYARFSNGMNDVLRDIVQPGT